MMHIALVDRVAHLEVGGQDSTLDHRLDGVGVGGGDDAVGAVAVDDVPLFGSRLDILGAGGSGLCTVLRDKHGCGHRSRADGGGDGLPVLFDKGLHARRSRLGRGQQDASEALRMLGAATRVRSTLGRPGSFRLTAEGVIWRKKECSAAEGSGFGTMFLVKLLLISTAEHYMLR